MLFAQNIGELERLADKFGVPLIIAAALGWILWSILRRLVSKHVESLERRDAAFESMAKDFPSVCKAQCPKTEPHD